MLDKKQICMIHGTDYESMTRALLEKCDLASMIPSKNTRIGIKPNLVSASPASCGATTHPEVVTALIRYLQENSFRNICVLEGSWVGEKTANALEATGFDEAVRSCNVPFIDTQKDKTVMTDCAGMDIAICKSVLDVEFLINVPVLKGHCQTKITCALKNMKGIIPNREKRHFHSMGLHKPIAHLNAAVRQDFILVDNICGDLDFEEGGNPVVMNRLLAGRDPVLIDSYVCQLMHYRVSDVPYIGMAEKLGVGTADLSMADICSVDHAEIEEIPVSRKVVEVEDHVQEIESCSACYAYLIPALDMLKRDGLLEKLDEKICIGQGFRKKEGVLGVGHCTAGFLHHLEGCPPLENDIYEFLKGYILSREKEG